jgi:hypothetical protein
MTEIKFLTAKQVADRWESAGITGIGGSAIAQNTLAGWRWSGKGPEHKKLFGFIRYPIDTLRDYETKQFGTTCDPEKSAINDNKSQETGENEAA